MENLLDFNSDYTRNLAGSMFYYPDTSVHPKSNEFKTNQTPGFTPDHAGVAAAANLNNRVSAVTRRIVTTMLAARKRKAALAGSGVLKTKLPHSKYGFF